MNTLDFSPFYRSTVGFDRLLSGLNNIGSQSDYPPYNIELIEKNTYRITMAVAGFSKEDLCIEVKENILKVNGDKKNNSDSDKSKFLFQGVAMESFEKCFQLADHVEIKNANIENGLLHIELHRKIPESMKPKKIEIKSGLNKQIAG